MTNEQIHELAGLKNKTIPFKGGRPKRERVISKDEIVNLRILLNTEDLSFDQFLQQC